MAGVSCVNHFLTKTLSVSPPQLQLVQKNSVSPTNSIRIPSKKLIQSFKKLSIPSPNRSRSVSRIRVVDEATVVEEPIEKEVTDTKKALLDSIYGTDRGLTASYETRAEILELITQLESENPTPAPTDALPLLDGKWILAYTSFHGLLSLLAKGTQPLVKVEEISQIIDSEEFSVQNSVLFSVPFATTSFSTNAKFEIRTPKRVQLKFEEGVIGTPQITDSIEIPELEDAEFFGYKIDLTPIKNLIASIEDTASSVAKTISSQPSLKIPITYGDAQWLLTTYLDEELRISRGDGGKVFVLIKEGSSLLTL